MAEISAADVKKLRDQTGAGMMECKKALQEAEGDFDRARKVLRERGLADAAKRKGREANDGLVYSYLHAPTPGLPPKVGVLVEIQTETDFVAKTDEVQGLAQDVAMHIAAMRPAYLSRDEVPEGVLATERELAEKKAEGKPDKVRDQIVEGALDKFYKEVCLLEQPFVRDEKGKTTVKELVDELVAKIGENIGVRRFVRYEVAEEAE